MGKFTDTELISILTSSKSYAEAARKLGYAPNGKIYKIIDKISLKLNIVLPFTHTGYNKKIDLTNRTFGHLTVIKEDKERTALGKGSYWFCKCDCGNINMKSILASNLTTGKIKSCGHMRAQHFQGQSSGEKKLENILINKQVKFIKEYEIKELNDLYNLQLRFDFCIILKNKIILIEIQGQQHYEPINYFGGQEKFQKQQKYDNLKRKYCKDNNIQLIEIPYWDWNNMEKYLGGLFDE